MDNKKQVSTDKHSYRVWVPLASAGAVALPHFVAALAKQNLWIAFAGQVLGLAVLFSVRAIFPMPTDQ